MGTCSDFISFSQFWQSHSLSEALACSFQSAPVDPAHTAASLWLIIALPLLGSIACGLFGRTLGRANTGLIACMAVAGSFALCLLVAWVLNDHQLTTPNPFSVTPARYSIAHDHGTWFAAGGFTAHLGLRADHLSASMLLIITGVGLLIHIYSVGYMGRDDGYWRYFAYLNLFVAMMLTLVLADGMTLMFVGWEGVGLCSYLLIGYWYSDAAKAYAGRKAFVTNRVGDVGFLLGMFLLVLLVEAFRQQAPPESFGPRGTYPAQSVAEKWRTGISAVGPLNFQGLEEMARALAPRASPAPLELSTPIAAGPLAGFGFGQVLTAVLLLFMLGAAGKSAQLPLYVWLPDAMAGPTPVSALIHAATMVTAGVYLFCRLSYLVVLSPAAMATIALVGGLTALLAAVIAFAQDDIKKVLAYSTVSQLGIMFIGVGVGVFWAALLHVVTHAFFKACLFLGAGSVMHGNGDETHVKRLGGLRRSMRWTWATFLVATLAITGIIPLSGFFSKDAILHGAHATTLNAFPQVTGWVWALGLVTAGCTAFYMTRLYLLTFEGPRSREAKVSHPHESEWPMLLPLWVLAGLSVVFAYHGIPRRFDGGPLQPMMENYLSPVFATAKEIARQSQLFTTHHDAGMPWSAWGLAWAIAAAGGGLGYVLYARVFPSWAGKPSPKMFKSVRRVVQNKFYVDELYDLVIVRPIKLLSFMLFKVVDALLIDAVAVRGTAWVTVRAGSMLRYLQTGDAQSYAAVMVIAAASGIAYLVWRVLQ